MHSICEPSVHGRPWKQQAPMSSGHSTTPHAVSSPWKMPPWLAQRAIGRTVQRFPPKQQAPVCARAECEAAKTTAKAARPSIARTPRLACLECSLIVPGIHTTHGTSHYSARPNAGAIGRPVRAPPVPLTYIGRHSPKSNRTLGRSTPFPRTAPRSARPATKRAAICTARKHVAEWNRVP